MKAIQMVDLVTQYRKIQTEMDLAILDTVGSGHYINGEAVKEFASGLADYTGSKYAIPCANGTDALQIALMAMDLQPGDEAIVPAFTYAATAEAITLLKLKPVAVDVNPQTFNIDVNKIEEAVSPKTKVIIPVNLFGQTADMETIMQVARDRNLYVIEDNAQSIGSVYTFSNGTKKQAGTIGNVGILSFFPTKNLGCYGDGGALLTNDEELAVKLKMITLHGQSQKYRHEIIGCNSRLDTLQAAILNVKLPHLDSWIKARKKTATCYDSALSSLTDLLEIPYCIPSVDHVYNQYTLKIKQNRDGLQKYLKEKGIPTTVYYPLPLHHQPAFKDKIRAGGDLRVSESLCKSALSLPMHTELDEEQIQYIISGIINYK
ncbi:MAG: DegT/DnrJ/EryC1/StrS family aminotransferase [Dysgonamonadaceae bacterium]|jgi:dTDP-4-amino-4,6-dideoxygalactose transaminase|nr:DegT/DnrJ/EryC1/StrS family aminotransferase [Dysgonamonadaceae bacterium]